MIRDVASAWLGEGELDYRTGALIVAGSGVLFSFTGILFRGVEDASDWQFLVLRGGGATLAMLTIIALRAGRRPVPLRNVGLRTGLAGVLLSGMSMLYVLAFARTTVATVTFLIAAGPLSGALFGRVILGERLTRTTVIAIGLAASGIAVMAIDGIDAGAIDGFLLAAAIPAMLGLYNVLVRSTPTVDPVIPALIANSIVVVVAASVALADTGLAMSLRDVGLGFVAGFVLIGVGLPLFNLGHRSVPTAQISLLIMTELVLAPVWVWVWPGERPSAATLVGGSVVLAAVVFQILAADRVPVRQPAV